MPHSKVNLKASCLFNGSKFGRGYFAQLHVIHYLSCEILVRPVLQGRDGNFN